MKLERRLLLGIGMPENLTEIKSVLYPSSVGVIMHTGDFVFEERKKNRSGEPQVLVVRQADMLVEGIHPWGIPAGRSQEGEWLIQTAVREASEETGVDIDSSRLRWFCNYGEGASVLSYQIDPREIPRWEEAEEYELGVRVIPPGQKINTSEMKHLVNVFYPDSVMSKFHSAIISLEIIPRMVR